MKQLEIENLHLINLRAKLMAGKARADATAITFYTLDDQDFCEELGIPHVVEESMFNAVLTQIENKIITNEERLSKYSERFESYE
jgi:hypothetical protein